MGPAWRAGHAIAIVMHWKDGRIPGKPLLGKDIQRPTRLVSNGVASRAIACYWCTENVLKNHLRSPGFFFEDVRRLVIDQLMTVTMAGNFMALSRNPFHQLWRTLSDPPKGKKGRSYTCPLE